MNRLSRIVRAGLAPDGQDVWDEIAGPGGNIRGSFHALIRIPELAQTVWRVGNHVRFKSALTEAERELTILATSRICGAEHEWGLHVPRAKKAGVRPEAIDVLATDGDVASLQPRERIVVEVTRSLLKGFGIDDALYARASAEYDEERLVELVALVGFYATLSMLTGSFGIVES